MKVVKIINKPQIFDFLNSLFIKLYIHIFAHQNEPLFLPFSLY